jgi:hypothetical protein
MLRWLFETKELQCIFTFDFFAESMNKTALSASNLYIENSALKHFNNLASSVLVLVVK